MTKIPPGLSGVVVTDTRLSDVRGREGFYHYRDHSAIELAKTRTFEDVWHLMLHGTLPDAGQREALIGEVAVARRLSPAVLAALPAIAEAARTPFNGLALLRSALSLVGVSEGFRPVYDLDADGRRRDAVTACAAVPTIVTALYRLANGQTPVEPRGDLSHTANYLYMLTGDEPEAEHVHAIEQYLISTIEHGFNASTFASRVIASTGADMIACLAGGIGALSGPLHGGAPSRALDTLDEIGTPDQIDTWVRDRVLAGDRIMGFGHPIYRTEDPRSRMLREIAQGFGGPLFEFAVEVESAVLRILAELKPGRELHTNVEFYAGVVMEQCGLPREMFTPTFAVARVVGWSANVLEQATDPKIIRPVARYVGPPPPADHSPVSGLTTT
jgi:citrate synthase